MKYLFLLFIAALGGVWIYGAFFYVRPPMPRLAPPGVFYLTDYYSARTPQGLVGFGPGQEVRLVAGKRSPGRRVVTDGRHEVEVNSSALTDDLDIAAALRRSEESGQETASAFAEERRQTAQRADEVTGKARSAEMERIGSQMSQASSVGSYTGRLDLPGGARRDYYGSYQGSPYYGYGSSGGGGGSGDTVVIYNVSGGGSRAASGPAPTPISSKIIVGQPSRHQPGDTIALY